MRPARVPRCPSMSCAAKSFEITSREHSPPRRRPASSHNTLFRAGECLRLTRSLSEVTVRPVSCAALPGHRVAPAPELLPGDCCAEHVSAEGGGWVLLVGVSTLPVWRPSGARFVQTPTSLVGTAGQVQYPGPITETAPLLRRASRLTINAGASNRQSIAAFRRKFPVTTTGSMMPGAEGPKVRGGPRFDADGPGRGCVQAKGVLNLKHAGLIVVPSACRRFRSGGRCPVTPNYSHNPSLEKGCGPPVYDQRVLRQVTGSARHRGFARTRSPSCRRFVRSNCPCTFERRGRISSRWSRVPDFQSRVNPDQHNSWRLHGLLCHPLRWDAMSSLLG
jgi:hypothetical protein